LPPRRTAFSRGSDAPQPAIPESLRLQLHVLAYNLANFLRPFDTGGALLYRAGIFMVERWRRGETVLRAGFTPPCNKSVAKHS
jgi:hypothetical protein